MAPLPRGVFVKKCANKGLIFCVSYRKQMGVFVTPRGKRVKRVQKIPKMEHLSGGSVRGGASFGLVVRVHGTA